MAGRDVACAVVQRHGRRDDLPHRAAAGVSQRVRLLSAESSGAHAEYLHDGLLVVAGRAEEVLLAVRIGDNSLAFAELLDGLELVAEARRTLEIKLLGRLPHPGLHLTGDVIGLTVEESDDLAGDLLVLVLGDLAGTRPETPAHVVVETGLADGLADGLAGELFAALAQAEELTDHAARPPDDDCRRIRAEDFAGAEAVDFVALGVVEAAPMPAPSAGDTDCGVGGQIPDDHQARVHLGGQAQIGVALVVAQADVEARLVLLDEGGFED